MGWQDAPLAKTPAGKPNWESAPLAAPAKGPKLTPGVAAAYRELEQRYKYSPDDTMSGRVAESATLGGLGFATRNISKGRVAALKAVGVKMPYTADEYYEASRLFDANRREKYAKENPTKAFIGDVAGGFVMPGGKLIEGFVTGSKAARLAAAGLKVPKLTRAGQATRLSAVGGTFAATQGALQSRSGEAATQAKQQGLTGAVLAPVVGAAIPAGFKVAEKLADITSRVIQPRTATQLASEKLGGLLQRAQVAPAAIRDALEHYNSTGTIEPSVYDVLRKAGAGPDILKFFQVSGSYPATRTAATKQAAETTKALQSKALEATRKLAPSPEALAEGVAPTSITVPTGSKGLYGDVAETLSASENAYSSAFADARKANPESAIIADEQRTPLRTTLYQAMSPFLNPDLKSTSTVAKLADDLVDGIVPADAAGEFSKNARPLTVAELFGKRTALVELADNFTKSGDNQAAGAAEAAKKALDDELTRLSAEGHIQGDPKVVDLWNQGLQGFAQHQQLKEAYGLGEKLRTMPSDEFQQAVTNVPENLKAMVQAGGAQQLLNTLEKPAPGSTGLLGDLQSARDTSNLAAMYGDEGPKFQQTLADLGTQARNTQELAQAVEGETPSDFSMIEQPVDLVRPRLLAARTFLSKLRGKTRLSAEESLALYNLMNNRGATDLADLARIKTVGPVPSLSVPVSRAVNNRREKKTLDEMSNEYDLNY